MLQDLHGQECSIDNLSAMESWSATQTAFLAHAAATPQHLAKTLERDPDFALAHAVKGMFFYLLGRREMIEGAEAALNAARAASARRRVTRRESLYVEALGHLLDGEARLTVACLMQILATHPGDALALKLDHALRFIMGDGRGMRATLESALPAYGADHAARGYVLGCHAFALEETGDYSAARRAGEAGLALCGDDAWGLHAVAHVHDMTADFTGGLDWLDGREAAWAHCNNFRYHVWWHKALMHLELGQTDVVLDLYDAQIRADKTDDYRDIANATSLLMRLELEGVDVAQRWCELADLSARRTEDGCLIFADLHYLMALVNDGRGQETARILGRLHRDVKTRGDDMARAMADPGLSAAAGLEAFGEARFDVAFLNFAKARPTMQGAGGSHAQRDVFERLTIDSGIRSGYLDEAEKFLVDRTEKRAGREDAYAASRHRLIYEARRVAACKGRILAE